MSKSLTSLFCFIQIGPISKLKLDENVQDQIARIGNKMVQFIEQ